MARLDLRAAGAMLLLTTLAPAQLAIHEVLVDPVGTDAGNQIVEIKNVTKSPFAPRGWQICAPFTYAPLPATSIAAGAVVRLHLGASGTDTATDYFFPRFRPLARADTFQIYRSSNFSNASDIVDFVSWGGGTARMSQAQSIGQWPTSGRLTVPLPAGEGRTIAWTGSGDTPLAWFRDASPTLGADNGSPTILRIGSGCGNRGTPLVQHPTLAVDGNLDHTVRVTGSRPGRNVVVFLGLQPAGSVPVLGCTLEVLPMVQLAATADAAGNADVPLPLQLQFSLTGISLLFQGVLLDTVFANGAFGATAGERLTIG